MAVPNITSSSAAAGTVGAAFSYQIATDSATAVTEYGCEGGVGAIPSGLSLDSTAGLLSGAPTAAGSYPLLLFATNASGTGPFFQFTVTLADAPPAPVVPVITSPTADTAAVGVPYSYQITADNSPTSFHAEYLPAGFSVDTTAGIISGTPTTPGTVNIPFGATNAAGTRDATLTLTIAPPPAPAITSAAAAYGAVGVAFSYQIAASGSPTSFTATGLPGGLNVSTATGVISGTPTAAGNTSATISATNSGGTGAATLSVTISAALSIPVIAGAGTANGTVGAAFSYQIAATNTPTSFAAMGSVPPGLTLNAASGLLSGTPTAAGTSTLVLTAANAAGNSAPQNLTVTILAPAAVVPGAPGAVPTGFLNGSPAGAPIGVVPIPIGSISGALAVRLPGASLSINDFGLDVSEPSWRCRTAVAALLKPDLYDAHPYLPNLFCVGSTSTEDEGLTSTLRATYKGLVKGIVRPWKPSMHDDTDPQTLTFNNGITGVGGGGSFFGGASGASSQNTITIANIPVPSPVWVMRGASLTQPDSSTLGTYFASPPGNPKIPATFTYNAYDQVTLDGPIVLIATLVFIQNPLGWLCDRFEYEQAGYSWECTQQWRMKYVIHNYIYPGGNSQKGTFTVSPTTVAAGQSIPVAFAGSNTNWDNTLQIFTNGGTITNLAVNTATQIASGTYTAPGYATVVTFGASGIDSTNTMTVTAA